VKAQIHGTMPDGRVGWIRAEIVASLPAGLRPDGPGTKLSAAVRADIMQNVFDAGTRERAFKRANHHLRGIRRKRRIAVLTSRS
jgi:hypothetical protein